MFLTVARRMYQEQSRVGSISVDLSGFPGERARAHFPNSDWYSSQRVEPKKGKSQRKFVRSREVDMQVES